MARAPLQRNSRASSSWKAQSRLRYRPRQRPRPYSRSRGGSRLRPRSRSRSPRQRPRSRSRIRGGSRSRSHRRSESNVSNPGNTLYVSGLSYKVTRRELEEYFSKEGRVSSCVLVLEPLTGISRGFGFVTMDSIEDANRCIKNLNQSVLKGRRITVERAKKARPRTPAHFLGRQDTREYGYRGGHDHSTRHPPYGGRSRTRRDRYRSHPHFSPHGIPNRQYARRSR